MDGPSHSPPDISKAVPSKSILKKRDSQDPDSHHTDFTTSRSVGRNEHIGDLPPS